MNNICRTLNAIHIKAKVVIGPLVPESKILKVF